MYVCVYVPTYVCIIYFDYVYVLGTTLYGLLVFCVTHCWKNNNYCFYTLVTFAVYIMGGDVLNKNVMNTS